MWLQVGGAFAVGGGHCGFHAQVQRRWLWANSCSQSPAFNSLALRCSSPHAVNSFVWLDGILEWYGNVFILKQKNNVGVYLFLVFFLIKMFLMTVGIIRKLYLRESASDGILAHCFLEKKHDVELVERERREN